MKLGKLKVGRDKKIKKKDYTNKKEYKTDKQTLLVPKRRNRLICIMFSEDKGCYFLLKKFNSKDDNFIFRNGMYILDNEAIHTCSNGSRVAFYMEGVSTPLKDSNIEKVTVEKEYTDLYGVKRKSVIQKIKGLKFDSKILGTFANRKFAELFTKQPLDKMGLFILIIFIMSIVSLAILCISCAISYFYR